MRITTFRFDWLKRLMPRGLYGRAALILILPVVAIQLVVSVTFLQRHFEGVTRQMTDNIALEIALALHLFNRAPDPLSGLESARQTATPLALQVEIPPFSPAPGDRRVFYDLSGRVIIDRLRTLVPGVRAIDLWDLRNVNLVIDTPKGPLLMRFDRGQVSASNPHQLLVLMVATSLLMTVIAIIFLRNQLRPIRRMALAAEAFGRGRTVPYRPTGATEVRIAGNAFLDMRNRIERQIEQRTLLLSGVSHDLRTPLTRLRLGLSMIDDEEVPALLADVDEMQRMLDAFLDFARASAEVDPAEEIDPVEFLRGIVADYRRTGMQVALVAVEGAGTARLSRVALRRALDNLIGNALRYGHRADLSVTILERSVRFTVEDDGPGIPRDQREEALKPFTRLDQSRNQNRGGGVGLGLSITADIVRSHGGSLRLSDSETLGGLKAEIVLGR